MRYLSNIQKPLLPLSSDPSHLFHQFAYSSRCYNIVNIQMQALRELIENIITLEQELEALRQLLNQEIQFSVQDTYAVVAGASNLLNLLTIKRFIVSQDHHVKAEDNDKAIESMIKFYSKGNLYIHIQNWKAMLLSREDLLLAKLAKERQPLPQQPPQYILSYCKKLILKQVHLHACIHRLPFAQLDKLEEICKDIFLNLHQHQIQIFKRYLHQGQSNNCHDAFPIQSFRQLITFSNSTPICKFLQQKERQLMQKQNSKCVNNHALVHCQFRKLASNKETSYYFSLRQAKSIENHINRNSSPSSQEIISKISAYTLDLQKQLKVFFKYFRRVMNLNAAIVQTKIELLTSNHVNFSMIFGEISKNSEIIPSDLQHYFRTMSIDVSLPQIFILFKRYCDPISGKISKKQFNSIFKLQKNPQFQKTTKINSSFRRNTVLCLLNEIDWEGKIEQQKRRLLSKVDLRSIFQAMDVGNNHSLSQTDVKIMHKKITGKNMQEGVIDQFWWRMRAKRGEIVDYDRFMYELIPRTKRC